MTTVLGVPGFLKGAEMAAKAPKMKVSLLIYISQGQVTQVREGKQQYNTLHPPLVETDA